MVKYLKNLVANSGYIAKALVSIVSSITLALVTHSWTSVPAIISDVFSVLVFLIPNSPKVTTNAPSNPSV